MTSGATTGVPVPAEPAVRRRLRRRPPEPVRRALGQYVALVGYYLLIAVVLLLVTVLGVKGAADASARLVPFLLAAAGVVFVGRRVIPTRQRWALAVAVGSSLAVQLACYYILVQVVGGGATELDGNSAFFSVVLAAVGPILALPAMLNLLRARRWFNGERERQIRADEIGARPIADPLMGPARAATAALPAPTAAPTDRPVAAPSGTIEIGAIVPLPASAARDRSAAGPLLAVRDLRKHFPIHGGVLRRQIGTVYAVDGVTFDVMRGETFSLVGESGCGKTTLGRTVLQLTPPTSGRVVFDGYELEDVEPNDMRPLRRRMQIIFQDPFGSLNPRMPISDIIGEGLLSQGLTDRQARDKKVEDSLEIVGLRREYTRRYPHEFSGGQRQRIGVARALALSPDFIVADEPVSALDVSIQSQVLNLLYDLKRDLNLTYLFISHNLSVIQYFSDRVGVMYLGKLVEIGTVEQLYRNPRHPYTVALLSAIPEADPRRRRKRLILKGDLPSPAAPPAGCRFHTRCWLRERLGNPENCVTQEPEVRSLGDTGHQVACHWTEEISQTTVSEAAAESPAIVAAAVEDE